MKDGKGSVVIRHDAYDDAFVERVRKTATQSASVMVDILMDMFHPRSVMDLGCGSGSWLRVFAERGVERIRGYDGGWVPRDKLRIPEDSFIAMDLGKELPTVAGYDLAISLEVAEHLPGTRAGQLVQCLARAAPVVVFSAAIPGQGGTNHINLQWPWYWRDLFAAQGFVCCDPIRPLLWCDERVDWVYRQNVYVFLSHEAFRAHPDLEKYQVGKQRPEKLTVIEERILRSQTMPDAQPVAVLMGALIRKLGRRMHLT
jgi:SAM-dependent methyltransferase